MADIGNEEATEDSKVTFPKSQSTNNNPMNECSSKRGKLISDFVTYIFVLPLENELSEGMEGGEDTFPYKTILNLMNRK